MGWWMDEWRWQVMPLPQTEHADRILYALTRVSEALPAGAHLPAPVGVWGALTQRSVGKDPWIPSDKLLEMESLGLCLHPPIPSAEARRVKRSPRARAIKQLMSRTLARHLPAPYGPGYRPLPNQTRVVYSDASISWDRDTATYGVVSSDGLEASGYLSIPDAVPPEFMIEWAELAAATKAVELINGDAAWADVPACDTVLYSDNVALDGFAAGAYTVVYTRRVSDPQLAEEFSNLESQITSSGCSWVGWKSPGERDRYLLGRADNLAFTLRRPDVLPARSY